MCAANRQRVRRRSDRTSVVALLVAVLLASMTTEPAAAADSTSDVAAGAHVVIRRFVFEGNRAIGDTTLQAIARPWLGRPIAMEDLQDLRLALTRAYVERGFVTSGAVLPDQVVEEGVLRFRIVEGRLGSIRVTGTDRFDRRVLAERMRPPEDAIVDAHAIAERLRRLRADPRIEAVAAELRPGLAPGVAELAVRVVERRALGVSARFDNHVSPAVGELGGGLQIEHENLSGVGDTLRTTVGGTEGLLDVDMGYQRPLNRHMTRASVFGRYSESKIVEEPFDTLDILSRLAQVGIELTQPIHAGPRTTVELGLRADWAESRSTLDDVSFDFTPGSRRGVTRVTALRLVQGIVHRGADQGLTANSVVSFGLPIFGATENDGGIEDGRFVSWLFRASFVRRLPLDALLIFRFESQIASNPLLPIERFSVGGFGTVRGHRQNQLVRDTGFATSTELRLPLWRSPGGGSEIVLAPFFDAGRSRNKGRGGTPAPKNLLSAGVGLRGEFDDRISVELYWGEAIGGRPRPSERSLQDRGLHFRVAVHYR